MADKPTTTVERKTLVALTGAIGYLHEAHQTHSVAAFNNICDALAEHASAINDVYVPLNDAWQRPDGKAPKTPRDPMSFRRFWDALVALCTAQKVTVPNSQETRRMFLFVRYGNSDAARNKFMRVVAQTGDYDLTFNEYASYLPTAGVRYETNGKRTESYQKELDKAAADQAAAKVIRQAAATSRPLAYDFEPLIPAEIRGDTQKTVEWAKLLAQDLSVWIDGKVKTLTDAQVKRVNNAVNREIKAHAVKS